MDQSTGHSPVPLSKDGADRDGATTSSPSDDGCPLLCLPKELRLTIIELALQAQHPVVNVGHLPAYKKGVKFNISLFTVCQSIFKEARDVFYKDNTIRVKNLNDAYLRRNFTEHLEITGDVANRALVWDAPGTRAAALAMTNLPKLKSLTMAVDALYDQYPKGRRLEIVTKVHLSTGMVVTVDDQGGPDRVSTRHIDYGMITPQDPAFYEVRFGRKLFEVQVILKRFRLVDVVQHARSLQPVTKTLEELRRAFAGASSREYIRAGFVYWIAGLEARRGLLAGKSLPDGDQVLLDGPLSISPDLQNDLERLHRLIPLDTKLLDLTVEQYGAEIFQLADAVVGFVNLIPPSWRRA